MLKKSLKFYICTLACLFIFIISTSLEASYQSLMDEAGYQYKQRAIGTHLDQSISIYKSALKQTTLPDEHYDCLWKLGRSYSQRKDYGGGSDAEIKTLLEDGITVLEEALAIQPKGVDALYWHGVTLGRLAEVQGIMNSLFVVKPMRNNMKMILDEDPTYYRAHFVLSNLYRKAPKIISIGNIKKAHKHILKAIKGDPNESLYLLEYARVLVDLKKTDEAKEVLNKLINLPYEDKYFKPRVEMDKKEAVVLLNSLK